MAIRGNRRSSTAAGPKTLLTALALLGTFGGWAYFAAEGAADLEATPTPQKLTLDLPPIPTLVPTLDMVQSQGEKETVQPTPAPPVLRQVNQPASVGSSGGGGGRSAARTQSSR